MYLKRVTMKGFKSFPEKTTLEFGPGTSVIVGPNGSGKSNVTDAVQWALGEQSPVAIRGATMQDVIFGGAPARQASRSASVELVLDDSEGVLGIGPEVSIQRTLNRDGEGEYRLAGARCRLIDVLEALSDTGLGKEMHSVISQGRVEEIVTSKPGDRRLVIEEAAGLGKHRKRRRRAQLKLEHTRENLDRALDVEREARSRLRPLKRQAEAAEVHERLHRQELEIGWELERDELLAREQELAAAGLAVEQVRAENARLDGRIAEVARERAAAEEALAQRSAKREELSRRAFSAQSAADRVGYRTEAIRSTLSAVASRLAEDRERVQSLSAALSADAPDAEAEGRIAALGRELEGLERDRVTEIARQVAELERQRDELAAVQEEREGALAKALAARQEAEAAVEAARVALREGERAHEAARRESARVGGELAAVNQFLRSHQRAPGNERSLADSLSVTAGFELAIAAALDGRLGAALAEGLGDAAKILDRAGADGGRVLISSLGLAGDAGPGGQESSACGSVGLTDVAGVQAGKPPVAGAIALGECVRGEDDAAKLARRLLAGAWVVEDIDAVMQSGSDPAIGSDFDGVIVTRSGRALVVGTGELRQAAAVGEDRVLAQRNRREELIAESERAVSAEVKAQAGLQVLADALAKAEGGREEAVAGQRSAGAARDECVETRARLQASIERRRAAPDDGPQAGRRAQLQAELRAERGTLERSQHDRQQRLDQLARLRGRIARDEALIEPVNAILAALADLRQAIDERKTQFDQALGTDHEEGERVAARLRSSAQAEAQLQNERRLANERSTAAEVRLHRARDGRDDADGRVRALANELQLAPEPATESLPAERREQLADQLLRLARRREQLGPVNPLAKQEYDDALEHVTELETQRTDLETAIRELTTLIRDTDKQIHETFDETFKAAAKNFEELVGRVFPGGHGRLRLVADDKSANPEDSDLDDTGNGEETDGENTSAATDSAAAASKNARPKTDATPNTLGVEIEVTPSGKAMKRLTLLSGGEKSMTALAFLFAVFLAKPCPFYILDEVEAALDDLNISRFLDLLETYSGRAQFIVVTHQKRTMEAADSLYGVSMGGDGISKVISRRLPAKAAPDGGAGDIA